jgi:hypothetical protein
MTTLTINRKVQQPGQDIYGPLPVAVGQSGVEVVFDGTITGGLYSRDASTSLSIQIQAAYVANPVESDWVNVCGMQNLPGGAPPDDDGHPAPPPNSRGNLVQSDNPNRAVRAVVTVLGPVSVALAGTITIT